MPSNFDFLTATHPGLVTEARKAEELVHEAPRTSCFYARIALEKALLWLYQADPTLVRPWQMRIGALIHAPSFKANLPEPLFTKVRAVYMAGVLATQRGQPLSTRDALRAVQDLFHFLYWLSRTYCEDASRHPSLVFDTTLVPPVTGPLRDATPEQLADLLARLEVSDPILRARDLTPERTEDEIARLKSEIKALKARNAAIPDNHDWSEAQTRDAFIDLMLREAGWPLDREGHHTEYEVDGMPNRTGRGFVDYVLWGADGRPLGLVEAKRTRLSPLKGEQQAKLYADSLERRFGRRPVIFLSNGYQTWIWDDHSYPRRELLAFYTREELEQLHHRRHHRGRPSQAVIDTTIVERPYQHQALRAVAEHFEAGHRRALLVMATGTGKTRVAIELTDMLMRTGWVKKSLFLADRTSLLTQARRAFKKFLPNATAVDLTQERDGTGNVLLSTYPTMMNLIDERVDGRRRFSPGSFELVIIDEAHRSVYQKYAGIFDYFDSLLVGLTATPRDEVHRDTYRLFELERGVPNHHYELREAVDDGFLVPPRGRPVPFRFMREGIKYAELPEDERDEYEEKLSDEETGALPPAVDAQALNRWLFNEDTVDKALQVLMEHGLKVAGGDRLGKTIVFARNHQHAEFIVERFSRAWPHHHGSFARVIDSHYDYAQSLLDEFSEKDKPPHIAVSVDMLDTGVDVPEVVNLVFFKPVRSKVKFQQMVGRGTRLCPDLFGPGQDKEIFLIFDLCGNFEYFGDPLEDDVRPLPASLTTRVVRARLDLQDLIHGVPEPCEEHQHIQAGLLDELHAHVAGMTTDNFLVRRQRRLVETFGERQRWNELSLVDREEVALLLAPLPTAAGAGEDPTARAFDLLCLKLQATMLAGSRAFLRLAEQARALAGQLTEKQAIPAVAARLAFIEEVHHEAWWRDVTLGMLEELRRKLRLLVQYIDVQAREPVYTDFTDSDIPAVLSDVDPPVWGTPDSLAQYRRKVEQYVRDHRDHLVIAKLHQNRPLTELDLGELERLLFEAEVGESRERFEEAYGSGRSLAAFIRGLVGLDREAAKAAFADYLEGQRMSATQMRFIDLIINTLTQNGAMDPGRLYEPPFADLHPQGLDGLFGDDDADNIVRILREVNHNGGVVFGEVAV